MWGWGYGGGYGNWLGWLGPLVMVLFWAAVITGIVFLVRYFIRQGSLRDLEDSALEGWLPMRTIKSSLREKSASLCALGRSGCLSSTDIEP